MRRAVTASLLDGSRMSHVNAQMGGNARVQKAENEGRKWLQTENSEQSTREAMRGKSKEMDRDAEYGRICRRRRVKCRKDKTKE